MVPSLFSTPVFWCVKHRLGVSPLTSHARPADMFQQVPESCDVMSGRDDGL